MRHREEFVVGRGAEIELAVDAGTVVVVNGAPDRIVIDVDGRRDEWLLDQAGSTVRGRPARRWRSRSTRVEVAVPEGCRVTVATATADIRLDGVFGPVRAKSASGDVQIGATADLQVSTATGGVRAADVDGDLDVATVSGDVRIGDVRGRVWSTTTSGDVDLGHVAGDLAANSVSGGLSVGRFDGDEFIAKSVSGDLDLGLPAGIRVSPEITSFSGSTRLPEPRPADPADAPRRRVRVAFRSVSGDVTIRRVDATG